MISTTQFEDDIKNAIKFFWNTRNQAAEKNQTLGISDQGERGGVTSGKNMDGFIDLIEKVVTEYGSTDFNIYKTKAYLTLPGYYRPTKLWDILVLYKGRLIAAIELKSQVGPSFGNNFNNRTEEAVGTAHDFAVAYRENAFNINDSEMHIEPFVGWLMHVEKADGSIRIVKDKATHFPVFKEFESASYLKRYDVLCQRLMSEKLYTFATIITSTRNSNLTGDYEELSGRTNIHGFLISLAGHLSMAKATLEVN